MPTRMLAGPPLLTYYHFQLLTVMMNTDMTTQILNDSQNSGEKGTACLTAKLREAGLRPTRQRLSLAHLLFSKGNRHVSAEALHEEAARSDIHVSLATVYNTLHQFNEAGLLRAVAIDSSKTYFDTNTSHHHHFYLEKENRVVDVPASLISVGELPEPPDGMEIARVDVIVRLREKN